MDKSEIKKLVGQKIKKHRTRLKLSQFALGEKVHINQRQIAQIECGKSLPSLNTLINFAEIFNCEISELFETEDFKSREEFLFEINSHLNKFDKQQLESILSIIKNVQ